jgi:uncharacterized protein (TIGR00369 family)
MKIGPKIQVDTSKGWDMCFGCGKDNPIGLKLKFEWDGTTARAEFTPHPNHQGWADIVHGGILFTILDEAMGYASIYTGMSCVTARMQARLRRPAVVGEPLVVAAKIANNEKKLLTITGTITLKDGTLVAEATGIMFILDNFPAENQNKQAES